MIEYFSNLNHVIQALLATIFTWSVTALGASLVFFFKKVNKNIMDAMLGFAGGVMIAASFFSLLSPAIEMACNLHMIAWVVAFTGFFSGGLLLFLGDKLFDFCNKKVKQNSNTKRCLMLVFSITLHNIP
ncbi:MAG: ZIP family metal transporter, partial [Bacilli bacterium]